MRFARRKVIRGKSSGVFLKVSFWLMIILASQKEVIIVVKM
ncbi:MAG: hypothetical protein CH104c_0060 [Candidatus Woesebacteria bacterium]|nr:MAG: hypothetical protein CH104c_0060 [Candidatus Woesebacteria bacterium]